MWKRDQAGGPWQYLSTSDTSVVCNTDALLLGRRDVRWLSHLWHLHLCCSLQKHCNVQAFVLYCRKHSWLLFCWLCVLLCSFTHKEAFSDCLPAVKCTSVCLSDCLPAGLSECLFICLSMFFIFGDNAVTATEAVLWVNWTVCSTAYFLMLQKWIHGWSISVILTRWCVFVIGFRATTFVNGAKEENLLEWICKSTSRRSKFLSCLCELPPCVCLFFMVFVFKSSAFFPQCKHMYSPKASLQLWCNRLCPMLALIRCSTLIAG